MNDETDVFDFSNVRVFWAQVFVAGPDDWNDEYEMWFRDLVTEDEGPRLKVGKDGVVQVVPFDED